MCPWATNLGPELMKAHLTPMWKARANMPDRSIRLKQGIILFISTIGRPITTTYFYHGRAVS